MSYRVIYSRYFLEKVFSWPEPLRKMAFEAADHAAQDPNLHDYSRQYLTPYKQKHPTTNGQYTLYFLIVSDDEIYISWINDKSCLHDTRNELTDPCLKEFQRRQKKNLIEKFDQSKHRLIFEVKPNPPKHPIPFMCRSKYLDQEVLLNSYFDQSTSTIIGHAFCCDEVHDGIAKIHVRGFLKKLHSELRQNQANVPFQIQFVKMGFEREIGLLTSEHGPKQWQVIPDNEDFILRKI